MLDFDNVITQLSIGIVVMERLDAARPAAIGSDRLDQLVACVINIARAIGEDCSVDLRVGRARHQGRRAHSAQAPDQAALGIVAEPLSAGLA